MALENLSKQSTEGCVAPGLHDEVSASGGATRTLTAADSGGTFLWDAATGVAYTLAPPVVGMKFRFIVSVAVTSNAHSFTTDAATTFLQGGVNQVIAASAVSEGQTGDGTSDVIFSQNGTTTGGLIGTDVVLECITATQWQVSGLVVSSGTLATMFA